MCSYRNTFLESHDFTATVLHPLAIIEVPIHILGTHILVFHTPSKMASIKWSMFALHVWSVLLDILMTAVTTPFVIFPFAAGSFTGFLSLLNAYKPIRLYLFETTIAATVTAILCLFENRYNALRIDKKQSETVRTLQAVANYILAFAFTMPPLFAVPEQSHAIQSVREQLPCLPSEVFDHPDFFVMSIDIRLMAYSAMAIAFTCCSQILYFFFRILRLLSRTENVSEHTQRIQKKFYVALSIQLSIPLLFLVCPVLYMIFAFMSGYFNQALNNLLFVVIALHGLVSTCVMLSVHSPYRQAVRKLICLWRKEDHRQTKRLSLVAYL